jgi:hypothetical protein
MSKIAISGASTGTATFTIESPATSTNRTLTLPDNTGTIITQNSTPAFASTIGVGGATAAASGAGITFPATVSASSDANTLDDYEEGTWTPAFTFSTSGSVTYSTQAGAYVKIGGMVFLTMNIILSGVSSPTGGVIINNLPFATPGGSERYIGSVAVGIVRNMNSSGLVIRAYKGAGGTDITISKNDTNANFVALQGSDLSASTLLYMSLTYPVF